MKRTLKFGTLLLIPLIAWGCDALFYDLDEPSFVAGGDMTPQRDMPATDMPATDMPAADMPATDMPATDMPATDMSVDMNDMSPDMPVDMSPPENVCVVGGELFGTCDPVAQNCVQGVCDLFFFANPGRLEGRCSTEPDAYTLPLGSACNGPTGADKCLPGLNCLVGNICRKNCDRLTGAGCSQDEFCRTFEPTLSIGYCAPDCP